jgi:hypothetical protein
VPNLQSPRRGALKIWYKIPPEAYSLDVESPIDASIGKLNDLSDILDFSGKAFIILNH